jgi:UDP-N-acetylmuramyl pentapeptide synthase
MHIVKQLKQTGEITMNEISPLISFNVNVVTNAGTAIIPVRCTRENVLETVAHVTRMKRAEVAEYNKTSTVALRIESVQIVIPAEQMFKLD